MEKRYSPVGFLLILTAAVLLVLGIIGAIEAYQSYANLFSAFPGLKLDRSLAIWSAGSILLGAWLVSLVLAALAQIVEATGASASEAEKQTEYLDRLVSSAVSRAPSVDDTARRIASEIRSKPQPK